MKVRRELSIRTDPGRIADFKAALEAAATAGWQRDIEAEEQASSSIREMSASFICDKADQREAATLTIFLNEVGTFENSRVDGRGPSELSDDQRNEIIRDFHDNVLRNISTTINASIYLGPDKVELNDLMSPLAMFALQSFAITAGKPIVALTDRAKEFWHYFLVTIQRDGHRLTSDLLTRWLTQEQGWHPMMADRLGREFAFGTELLSYAASRPNDAQ